MKLFELFATLSLDTEQFNNDSEKALQRADELGTKIGHAIANVLNSAESAGEWLADNAETIWDWGKTAVETAAEIRAENARFEKLFGDMADDATAAFKRVSESTGLLVYMLRGAGSDAYDLFVGAGMESVDALAAMELYMQLAADAAAAYDMSLADTHDHLLSFLRGNTEAGEAIHINITAATKDAKALELYNMKWKDLEETERQYVLLDIAKDVYKRNKVWGTAAEEADEYSTVLEKIKTQWRLSLAALGEPLLRNVLPVMSKISEWFEANPELVSKLGEGIGAVADKLGTMLLDLFEFIGSHSDEIIALLDGVISFVSEFFDMLSGRGKGIRQIVSNILPEEIGFEAGEVDKINEWVAAYQEYLDLKEKASRGAASSADVESAYSRQADLVTSLPFDLLERYHRWMGQEGYSLDNPVVLPIDAKLSTGAAGSLQGELDQTDLSVNVTPTFGGWKIPGWLTFLTGAPAFATGLDYVPYNDFGARLHEGEAVLTKAEAEAWRRHGVGGGGAPAIDYNLMAEAMLTAFSGVSLQMDKRVVGGLVGPTVSRDIARGARNRRYTG